MNYPQRRGTRPDEGMLERVGRLRWHPPLIDQFRLFELA